MSDNLPILYAGGELAVVDPTTGEPVVLPDASDHALAHACEKVAELDRELREARMALAAEMRERHGVGTTHAGGYRLKVVESTSWPVGATENALAQLRNEGWISEADAKRALPLKPKPDPVQLKALIGRLLVSDPEAAKVLSEAATVSPPSVREVRAEAVTEEAA